MKVEIDNLGVSHRKFSELRDELIATGQRFSEATLPFVHYSDLHLCCIADAGAAACSLKQVQQEKAGRRTRFLSMPPNELKEAERFLRVEQMYDDVLGVIGCRGVPYWDDLNDRQKAYAKLRCLSNHIDDPQKRIGESILLLRKCSTTCLPSEVSFAYMTKLKGLLSVFPGKLSDEVFRTKVADIAEDIFHFLPDSERGVLEREQLLDYSCTSNCFRISS
jgi:hypothetical protein